MLDDAAAPLVRESFVRYATGAHGAAYLELATREGLPLIAQDADLRAGGLAAPS